VKLRIDVNTEWVNTNFGPAQIGAKVYWYEVLFDDFDFPVSLIQPRHGLWKEFVRAPRVTLKRHTLYVAL
jgi:hypothetical protein